MTFLMLRMTFLMKNIIFLVQNMTKKVKNITSEAIFFIKKVIRKIPFGGFQGCFKRSRRLSGGRERCFISFKTEKQK